MHSATPKFCVLFALVASSFTTQALAQTTPAGATSGSVAYADEPIVIERADHLFSVATDGTGWKEHTFVARLQSDATVKKYGVLSVPYASNSEHRELLFVGWPC